MRYNQGGENMEKYTIPDMQIYYLEPVSVLTTSGDENETEIFGFSIISETGE